MGTAYRNSPDHHGFISPFENVIFYEEPIEEDAYDYQLIEDLFNPQRKIKISKSPQDRLRGRSLGHGVSRIETEGEDDSDSSIQENQTV